MIQFITLKSEKINIESTYYPSVITYSVVSEMMSDDYKPFRIAESVMVWINENGYIGEVECIYPIIVEKQMCIFKKTVKKLNGFPIFQVLCCDNEAYVQHQKSSFTVWFSKDKEIDTEVVFEQLNFLISNNELVAIVCKNIR